jgi:hypothetical protein
VSASFTCVLSASCSGVQTGVQMPKSHSFFGADLDINDDERVFARFPRVVAESLSHTLHIIFCGQATQRQKKENYALKSSLFCF